MGNAVLCRYVLRFRTRCATLEHLCCATDTGAKERTSENICDVGMDGSPRSIAEGLSNAWPGPHASRIQTFKSILRSDYKGIQTVNPVGGGALPAGGPSQVPVQMWHRDSVPVQMRQGRAQSRCGCGRATCCIRRSPLAAACCLLAGTFFMYEWVPVIHAM